jgi:hypothetical protein
VKKVYFWETMTDDACSLHNGQHGLFIEL